MPIVTIKLAKGRTVEQKRDLAKAVTDAVVSSIDVKPEWVTVLIDELERRIGLPADNCIVINLERDSENKVHNMTKRPWIAIIWFAVWGSSSLCGIFGYYRRLAAAGGLPGRGI